MKFKLNIVLFASLAWFISSCQGSINIALCRGADQAGGIGKAGEYKSFVGMICGGGVGGNCGNPNNMAHLVLCGMFGTSCGVHAGQISTLSDELGKSIPEAFDKNGGFQQVMQSPTVCAIVQQSCCLASSNQFNIDMANYFLSIVTDEAFKIPSQIPIPIGPGPINLNNLWAMAGGAGLLGKK